MTVDFPLILVLATVITGVIWAVDRAFWASGRRAEAERLRQAGADEETIAEQAGDPVLVEYARSFFPVILVVLLLRSFVAEPFRIPSGSMMPTLLVGDFILVNKFAYGLRLPVLDTKVIKVGEPKRGDVVVFRYPKDPSTDYIKRVIGLPGDHISYYHKVVYVNGKAMTQVPDGVYVGEGGGSSMTGADRRVENLNGVKHQILIEPGQATVEGEFVVPPGHYFVMGDNRDNSNDSRYWGTVPEGNLVGKAFLIWMSWDWNGGGLHLGRIGDVIR